MTTFSEKSNKKPIVKLNFPSNPEGAKLVEEKLNKAFDNYLQTIADLNVRLEMANDLWHKNETNKKIIAFVAIISSFLLFIYLHFLNINEYGYYLIIFAELLIIFKSIVIINRSVPLPPWEM